VRGLEGLCFWACWEVPWFRIEGLGFRIAPKLGGGQAALAYRALTGILLL